LRLYEHSLGLAFVLLFVVAWIGHALGGFAEFAADQVMHREPRPELDGLPDVRPILVRVVPELAKRISGDCLDGLACGVPPTAMVPRIETRTCAA
jgi:hypothetical protein